MATIRVVGVSTRLPGVAVRRAVGVVGSVLSAPMVPVRAGLRWLEPDRTGLESRRLATYLADKDVLVLAPVMVSRGGRPRR